MNLYLIILIGVCFLGFLILAYLIVKQRPNSSSPNNTLVDQWLKTNSTELKAEIQRLADVMHANQNTMNKTLTDSDRHISSTLQKSYQELNRRLDQATQAMTDLKTETGKFSEIGRSMKDLQQLLKSPKLRGGLGETILGELLSQMLPKQAYSLQYRFSNGSIVDAVILTQAGSIPIDAKFPFENFSQMIQATSSSQRASSSKLFERDVKKHIQDISSKYIQPQQATVDFALMYIPTEAIYYEIVTNHPSLADFAQLKRVLPVSPSTFYAFLRTILMSMEGQKIAAEAQKIIRGLREIQAITNQFGEKLSIHQKHVTHAYSSIRTLEDDFRQLSQTIHTTQLVNSSQVDQLEGSS